MLPAHAIAFAQSDLDRAAHVRSDDAALAAALAADNARTIIVWQGKLLLHRSRPAHVLRLPMKHSILHDASNPPMFLGFDAGKPVFVHELDRWRGPEPDMGGFIDQSEQQHPLMEAEQVFVELRRCMTWLPPCDAQLAAAARALCNWHGAHPFCSKCGDKTHPTHAGWQRNCTSCNAVHFPRTDPVVIMLVIYQNSVLVGRSYGWPEGMYSLLAGFVEPAETLEAAVRREVFEESGVCVESVRYLASQPWPFPASLMLGCSALALDPEITIDRNEIEDARWIEREEMAQVFLGTHPLIRPARTGSIAYALLKSWLADL